jgi:hypothetical protein
MRGGYGRSPPRRRSPSPVRRPARSPPRRKSRSRTPPRVSVIARLALTCNVEPCTFCTQKWQQQQHLGRLCMCMHAPPGTSCFVSVCSVDTSSGVRCRWLCAGPVMHSGRQVACPLFNMCVLVLLLCVRVPQALARRAGSPPARGRGRSPSSSRSSSRSRSSSSTSRGRRRNSTSSSSRSSSSSSSRSRSPPRRGRR